MDPSKGRPDGFYNNQPPGKFHLDHSIEYWEYCPYDATHQVLNTRMTIHMVNCRRNYMRRMQTVGYFPDMVPCRFNSRHQVPSPELPYHEARCMDQFNHIAPRRQAAEAPAELKEAGPSQAPKEQDDTEKAGSSLNDGGTSGHSESSGGFGTPCVGTSAGSATQSVVVNSESEPVEDLMAECHIEDVQASLNPAAQNVTPCRCFRHLFKDTEPGWP